MKTVKWWVEPGGHLKGITHQQQVESIEIGWKEIESVCDVKFERQSRSSRSRVDIYFVPGAEIDNSLGRGSSNGRIRINQDRSLNLTGIWNFDDHNINNRYAITLIQHEFHHTFDGPQHIHDFRECYMHPYLGYWMCPTEAFRLQKEYGNPKNIFHPIRRQYITHQMRQSQKELQVLQDFREEFLHQRATLPTKPERVAAHRKVLSNLREQQKVNAKISARAKEWHNINDSWKKVPGVR